MQKDSMVPMYYQITEQITKWIRDGVYKEKDKLPSENDLVKLFGVSKITVNKALANLTNRGSIYRVQGKGTFVASRVYTRESKSLLSFTKEYTEKGLNFKTQIVENTVIRDERIAKKLQIARDEDIIKYARLRFIDEKVIAYQISYISEAFCGELQFDKSVSLYEVLEQHGIEPQKANEKYNIVKVQDEKVAKLLQIKIGEPAFKVNRVSFDKKGKLFEYSESFLKWDSYTIEVTIEK